MAIQTRKKTVKNNFCSLSGGLPLLDDGIANLFGNWEGVRSPRLIQWCFLCLVEKSIGEAQNAGWVPILNWVIPRIFSLLEPNELSCEIEISACLMILNLKYLFYMTKSCLKSCFNKLPETNNIFIRGAVVVQWFVELTCDQAVLGSDPENLTFENCLVWVHSEKSRKKKFPLQSFFDQLNKKIMWKKYLFALKFENFLVAFLK